MGMEKEDAVTNVCRCFVLYNDFIPPTATPHTWPYLAFGYYDGFSIGGNLFGDNEKPNFMHLWSESLEKAKQLDETAMKQVVYGFRDENNTNRDHMFWEEDTVKEQYPFIFFAMIQFEESGRKKLEDLYDQKEQVERNYTEEGEYQGIIYLTLENSDLLLVVRSRSYETGARVIDRFHRKEPFYQNGSVKWEVKYSFTVASVDKELLKESGKPLDNHDMIDHAYLYVTERRGGSIEKYYKKLKKIFEEKLPKAKLDKESVLGYNDELITISDITWGDFLELYRVKAGLLNHSSDEYHKFLSGLTTIIGLKQDSAGSEILDEESEAESDEKKENGTKDPNKTFLFTDYVKRQLHDLAAIETSYQVPHRNMMMTLYNLVNSSSRFDNSPIRENLFFPASFTICQLITALKDMLCESNGYTKKMLCYRDYQRFLNGLNSYAQNWIKSDRQFIQSLDFNIKIYNLPVILNAFYNAFIFYVKLSLNRDNHSYEFLTCPGAAPNLVVSELFLGQSNTTRFFLVNIPENQMYDLKLMQIMLSHEVAHFVGAHIRKRRLRYLHLNIALCRMIANYCRKELGDWNRTETNSFWTEFEKKLSRELFDEERRYYKKERYEREYEKTVGQSEETFEKEINNIYERDKLIRFHSYSVRNVLQEILIGMIRNKREEYFAARLNMEYFGTYSSNQDVKQAEARRKKMEKKIEEICMQLVQVRSGSPQLVNLENMTEELLYFFKECLSDVVSIMLLQLTFTQYMEAMIQSVKAQGEQAVYNGDYIDENVIRIALVCGAMLQERENIDAGYGWNSSDIEISESTYTDGINTEKLSQKIRYVLSYLWQRANSDSQFNSEHASEESRDQADSVVNYLLDAKILTYIKRYLYKGRLMLARSMKKESLACEKLRKMFQLNQLVSAPKIMLQLHAYVDGYREEICKKMSELADDNSRKGGCGDV